MEVTGQLHGLAAGEKDADIHRIGEKSLLLPGIVRWSSNQ
jgi:hypothetical protein